MWETEAVGRSSAVHIVLCEDDPLYLRSIAEKIDQWSQTQCHMDTRIKTFASSEDLLKAWNVGFIADIFFLDIQFQNEMDGMELAKTIRATDMNVPIVFITNSTAYIREGYTVCALRYLSKPISYEDIAPCLDIAYKQYTLSHNEFLILSDAGRRLAVKHADILFLEAQSPYVVISRQAEDTPIKLRYRFSDIVQRLPQELFIPCHRSYVVNLIHIRCLKRAELLLSNDTVLPISRPYVNLLYCAFDSYYQEGCDFFHVDGV